MQAAIARAAASPILQLPLDCSLGRDCFVQNYVDEDASDEAHDYRCGARTYDRHNGTDFRIPNMVAQAAGVRVLAAADGVIARTRDGMEDISTRATGRNAVKGKECGNGIVITHKDGWSTQYCHLAKGSVSVHTSQTVVAGQPIGLVGLSGDTEFPHVHLTVRRGDVVVDPFAESQSKSCELGTSLWNPRIPNIGNYPRGEVLNFGFSSEQVSMSQIETGEATKHGIARNLPLLAYVRAIGLEKGDEQFLQITDPTGASLVEATIPPLENAKAEFFMTAGKRESQWLNGTYRATYSVKRAGQTVLSKEFTAELR
ncbi:M23 family metallopeptidase [Bradyrhizobium liaoningense]|nr:M23 family metallopeptidase [Bradyrhizobium liaoningense]